MVTRIPLETLAYDGAEYRKRRMLTRSDIASLLFQNQFLGFVVADIGRPLAHVPREDRVKFWKLDAAVHIADFGVPQKLEDYPGAWFYFASLWEAQGAEGKIVLLEKHH